jgi:hypothetical protein
MGQGSEDELSRMLTDVLILQKPGGQVFEGISAHVSQGRILILDVRLPIAIGDRFTRTLPSGLRVGFIVDDPGYREGLGSIPSHFEVEAHHAAPIDSLESADFWRTLRANFEQLSDRQHDALGLDREHPKWLRGYCSRLEGDSGEFAYCDIDGGLDPQFRSKFDDVATQAALALGSPPDGKSVEFWVSSLCLDILQNSVEAGGAELLRPVSGGGFIVDLLGSSAAYCSRLAAMADRKPSDKHEGRIEHRQGEVLKRSAVPPRAALQDLNTRDTSALLERKSGKRRGRRPNVERRDAIRSAISRYGDDWRDHLPEIFTELDNGNVDLGDFRATEVHLGGGQTAKVLKWEDLDLAEGNGRTRIIDVLRKYVD